MTATREGEFLVHAKANQEGFTSKVMSRQGLDGVTYYFHLVQDELSEIDNLEHPFKDGSSVLQVLKDAAGKKYFRYSSRSENDLHEYMKAHYAAVDMYLIRKGA